MERIRHLQANPKATVINKHVNPEELRFLEEAEMLSQVSPAGVNPEQQMMNN